MIISRCPDCGWEEWGIKPISKKYAAVTMYGMKKWRERNER